MKFLRSIRFRLVVLHWLLSILMLFVAVCVVYFRLREELEKITHTRLKEEAVEFVQAGHRTEASLQRFASEVEEQNAILRDPWLFFCASDLRGRVIARSADVPEGMMLSSPEGFETAKSGGKHTGQVYHVSPYPVLCRSFRMPLADGGECIVQIGVTQADSVQTLKSLRNDILIGMAPFAAALAVLGFLLVKWSLDPVKRITKTAESITAHDLSRRIPLPGTADEIESLCNAFNAMIRRLEDSFRRERQFGADASHELRTPISVIRSQMELALESERPAEEYPQVLTSCLEELNKLRTIADSLLLLARQDDVRLDEKRETVLLGEVLADVCEIGEIMAQERAVQLTSAGLDTHAPIWAHRQSIERLFLNLVENAVRYNTSNGRVSVRLCTEDRKAVVVVEDTGVGIAEAELPLIFERFYRGRNSRSESEGVGLGLSICKAVAGRHGGAIDVLSQLGKGSRFTVTLPLFTGNA